MENSSEKREIMRTWRQLMVVTLLAGNSIANQQGVGEFDLLVHAVTTDKQIITSNACGLIALQAWDGLDHQVMFQALLSTNLPLAALAAFGIVPTRVTGGWWSNQPLKTHIGCDAATLAEIAELRREAKQESAVIFSNALVSVDILLATISAATGKDIQMSGRWKRPVHIHSVRPLTAANVVDLLEASCALGGWSIVRVQKGKQGAYRLIVLAEENKQPWFEVLTIMSGTSGRAFRIDWSNGENDGQFNLEMLRKRIEGAIRNGAKTPAPK